MKWRIVHPGDRHAAVEYATNEFIGLAQLAIEERGAFFVALSGGSTPKAIFEKLAAPEYAARLDWSKVWLFWSDERSVPPHDSESNFSMAMSAGLSSLPIPKEQIVRMEAEAEIEMHAEAYEAKVRECVPDCRFDLVMLGMGPDAHTASLFPDTEALEEEERLVVANFVPQFQTWRMTFTYPLINHARHISIYLLGESKRDVMRAVWHGPYDPIQKPIQKIAAASWIIDFPPPAE